MAESLEYVVDEISRHKFRNVRDKEKFQEDLQSLAEKISV